jgi:cytoskeleton protein RodZ
MTQPEAEITELPSSPGARLKREREARGLTQHQAAEQLNLDPMVVHVLEANDFAALGAPVFVRGHLRRYAAMLGLREDEIVGAYERSKQQVEEPTLVPKARLEMAPVRERTRPRWRWVAGGAFAFLLAAALVAYVSNNGLPWGSSNEKQSAATLEAPPATQAPPFEPAPAPVSVPSAGGEATGTSAPPATAATEGTTPSAGPAESTPPAPVATAPGQVSLLLKFSGDSWVEVFDRSGRALMYDLGKSGTERTITATAPLSVTLGNAASVAISVNGRNLPLPPRAAGEVMARFSIDSSGTLH